MDTKSLSFLHSWEPQTPISSSKAPDPFLRLRDPRLLINMYRNWLSQLSAIMVVSSEYLSLLMFLLAILIPACESFSLAFCMRDSASKLNKQGDNMQPWQSQPHPHSPQNLVPFLGRRPSQVTTFCRSSSERSSETGGVTQHERAVT